MPLSANIGIFGTETLALILVFYRLVIISFLYCTCVKERAAVSLVPLHEFPDSAKKQTLRRQMGRRLIRSVNRLKKPIGAFGREIDPVDPSDEILIGHHSDTMLRDFDPTVG
jgi:hypothetical protein